MTLYNLKCKLKFIMGRKFSDDDLKLLLNRGLSQAEIAREFAVSEQAVSWRVKKLKTRKTEGDLSLLEKSNYQGNPSLKDQLNLKELKFLEFYLSGEYTIEKAMIAAGYSNYHPKYIHVELRKIIEKYEQQAGDHRKIFRAIGCGILRVAQKINKSMDAAKSEMVQFNYTQLAAKALGITKDVEQPSQGLTIIVQAQERGVCSTDQCRHPGACQPFPYNHPQPSTPGQPITITK